MSLTAKVKKLFCGRSGRAAMIPLAAAAAYAFAAPTPATSQQITIPEDQLDRNIGKLVDMVRAGANPVQIAPELAGSLRLKLELYGPDTATQAHPCREINQLSMSINVGGIKSKIVQSRY